MSVSSSLSRSLSSTSSNLEIFEATYKEYKGREDNRELGCRGGILRNRLKIGKCKKDQAKVNKTQIKLDILNDEDLNKNYMELGYIYTEDKRFSKAQEMFENAALDEKASEEAKKAAEDAAKKAAEDAEQEAYKQERVQTWVSTLPTNF